MQPDAGPVAETPAPQGRAADALLLAAVAAGGGLGSAARHGAGLVLPHDPGHGLPWSTLAVNGVGCLLIGVLMAVTERFGGHRLLRPFLGVGVLGGFTTFSTYTADIRIMLDRGAVTAAVGYLVLTVAVALAAVAAGSAATRRATGGSRPAVR